MSKSPQFFSGLHNQLLAGLNIFNKAFLKSEADVATAVDVLEGTLDAHSIGPIIHCSLLPERPYAFEFMISCMSEPFVLSRATLDTCHSRQRRHFHIHPRFHPQQIPYGR